MDEGIQFTFTRISQYIIIFLGVILTFLGLFLILPNILTAIILFVGVISIQIQVRLEEEYLLLVHGKIYKEYCQKVKRWIIL